MKIKTNKVVYIYVDVYTKPYLPTNQYYSNISIIIQNKKRFQYWNLSILNDYNTTSLYQLTASFSFANTQDYNL